jgi:glycosyltransferase involved in cell wall biosynthesis
MTRTSAPQGRRGPVRLVDVELSAPLRDVEPLRPQVGDAYAEIRLLVRLHRRPLGTVTLRMPAEGLDAGLMADAIWDRMGVAIRSHCRQDGLEVPEKLLADGLLHPVSTACSWRSALYGPALPLASVVITTCGGPGTRLTDTIAGALAQTYPNFEVVVVDNRPETSGVAVDLELAFPGERRVRYAAEPRRGLGHARNRGAAAARGELVAFTDDDVELDPDWLACLVAGFDHPDVACVTGLILPLELETEAQLLLEEFGGYAKGFQRRTWDAGRHRLDSPLYPYTVGAFGSGANAAFRRDALERIGGFDGVLGAGTAARGGEDLDIYVTCVQRGFRIVYEPAAIVRHAHLRAMAQVHGKVRDYGVGLGAMLTKHLFRDRASASALLSRVPAGVRHLLSNRSPKNAARSSDYPRALIVAELEGLIYGPLAYFRSRRSS